MANEAKNLPIKEEKPKADKAKDKKTETKDETPVVAPPKPDKEDKKDKDKPKSASNAIYTHRLDGKKVTEAESEVITRYLAGGEKVVNLVREGKLVPTNLTKVVDREIEIEEGDKKIRKTVEREVFKELKPLKQPEKVK